MRRDKKVRARENMAKIRRKRKVTSIDRKS